MNLPRFHALYPRPWGWRRRVAERLKLDQALEGLARPTLQAVHFNALDFGLELVAQFREQLRFQIIFVPGHNGGGNPGSTFLETALTAPMALRGLGWWRRGWGSMGCSCRISRRPSKNPGPT